jgi:hypothetical protein
MVFGDTEVRHVGAKRVATETRAANAAARITAEHDRSFAFSSGTVTVIRSDYYRRALLDRAVFAADVETHEYAFGTKLGFRDPLARVAQLVREHDNLMPQGPIVAVDEGAAESIKLLGGGRHDPNHWPDALKPHLEAWDKAQAMQAARVFVPSALDHDPDEHAGQ